MGDQKLDTDEFLNIFTVPFEDAIEDVYNGTITDGKSISAIMRAAVYTGYLRRKKNV